MCVVGVSVNADVCLGVFGMGVGVVCECEVSPGGMLGCIFGVSNC